MPDETRASRQRRRLSARAQTGLPANLRLFALLTVLVPLFGGFQYLAREGVPRVVELAPAPAVVEAVPIVVPVEVPVERVVFVPVERLDDSSPNVVEPGVAPVVISSSGVAPTTLSPTAPRDVASTTTSPDGAGVEPAEPSAPEAPASAQAAPPPAEAQAPELPVMGIVAIVPAPRPAVAPSAPARVAAPAEEPEESAPVADPQDEDEAEVADAPDDAVTMVVGTTAAGPAAVVIAAPTRPGRVANPSPSELTIDGGVNLSDGADDEQQVADQP
ncbi:MAG: hypothetical protein U0893_12525 [Chloroflexota bacterium]